VQVLIDTESVQTGSLFEDWAMLKPRQIPVRLPCPLSPLFDSHYPCAYSHAPWSHPWLRLWPCPWPWLTADLVVSCLCLIAVACTRGVCQPPLWVVSAMVARTRMRSSGTHPLPSPPARRMCDCQGIDGSACVCHLVWPASVKNVELAATTSPIKRCTV
jgi:hypothetical protein